MSEEEKLKTFIDVALSLTADGVALDPADGGPLAAAIINGSKTLFDAFFPTNNSNDVGKQVNTAYVKNEMQDDLDVINSSMEWWNDAADLLSTSTIPSPDSSEWDDPNSGVGELKANLAKDLSDNSDLWNAVTTLGEDSRFKEQSLAAFSVGASHYLSLSSRNILLEAYLQDTIDMQLISQLVSTSTQFINDFNNTKNSMITERTDDVSNVYEKDPPLNPGTGQPEGNVTWCFNDSHEHNKMRCYSSDSKAESHREQHIETHVASYTAANITPYTTPSIQWEVNMNQWNDILSNN